MKRLKTVICFLGLSGIFSSCVNASGDIHHVELRYDKKSNTLLIDLFESARYIHKIELDMKQDTLIVVNVSRSLVFGKKRALKTAKWTFKLVPNVKFIKLGKELYKISEIGNYSKEELIEQHIPVIEIFPHRFPYIAE